MIHAIACATDFSQENNVAFVHALRLAVLRRCRLDLVHVHAQDQAEHFERFPPVRKTMAAWGIIPAHTSVDDAAAVTGVDVYKTEVRDVDVVEGLSHYISDHQPDLVVMATHGRSGFERLMAGSISGQIAQETGVPTLLIGPRTTGFVDAATGQFSLRRIALPVDHSPVADLALARLATLFEPGEAVFDYFHVGDTAPPLRDAQGRSLPVRTLGGSPVKAILDAARDADLIVMPTEGRHGLLDFLRGSTTERVVHDAPCPVLAIPVGG